MGLPWSGDHPRPIHGSARLAWPGLSLTPCSLPVYPVAEWVLLLLTHSCHRALAHALLSLEHPSLPTPSHSSNRLQIFLQISAQPSIPSEDSLASERSLP